MKCNHSRFLRPGESVGRAKWSLKCPKLVFFSGVVEEISPPMVLRARVSTPTPSSAGSKTVFLVQW